MLVSKRDLVDAALAYTWNFNCVPANRKKSDENSQAANRKNINVKSTRFHWADCFFVMRSCILCCARFRKLTGAAKGNPFLHTRRQRNACENGPIAPELPFLIIKSAAKFLIVT